MVSYVVLVLAMLFEGTAWGMALREFRRTKGRRSYLQAVRGSKDPSLFVVLFEDTAALLGLLVAFGGILLGQITGEPRYDGLASVVIGLLLGGTAVWLAYETKGLLIGESADREVVEGIRRLAREQPEFQRVFEVLTLHMGPEFILVNLNVDFVDSVSAAQIESSVARFTRAVKEAFPRVKRVFVEGESLAGRGDLQI